MVVMTVRPRYGEVYTWKNVGCSVNNIIVGKLWIEHVSLGYSLLSVS